MVRRRRRTGDSTRPRRVVLDLRSSDRVSGDVLRDALGDDATTEGRFVVPRSRIPTEIYRLSGFEPLLRPPK